MRYLILGGASLLLLAYTTVQPAAFLRGSNLGIFEERYEGPVDVMMRMSPELRANYGAFDACMSKNSCDETKILAERDRIVGEVWPKVYERMKVGSDWGTCISCQLSEDYFQKARAEVGEFRLQYQCRPDVRYTWHRGNNPGEFGGYDSVGYSCDGKNITFPE